MPTFQPRPVAREDRTTGATMVEVDANEYARLLALLRALNAWDRRSVSVPLLLDDLWDALQACRAAGDGVEDTTDA